MQVLLKHCNSRNDPEPENVIPDLADQLIPPYYVDVAGNSDVVGRPRVSMSTAINLINRFGAAYVKTNFVN